MTEKEKFQKILKQLDNLEVKGINNVVIMFNLMTFCQSQILEKEAESKKLPDIV